METDFSGKDIYVSPDVKSGPLYNVTTGEPKTIEEVISEILYRVSNLEKESDVKKHKTLTEEIPPANYCQGMNLSRN